MVDLDSLNTADSMVSSAAEKADTLQIQTDRHPSKKWLKQMQRLRYALVMDELVWMRGAMSQYASELGSRERGDHDPEEWSDNRF